MNFMQAFLKILLIMAVLLAFILPGYFLRKAKLVAESVLPAFSNVLIYVCLPILMVKAFAVDPVKPSVDVAIEMGVVFLIALISLMAMYFLSKLAFRGMKDVKRRDVYSFVAVFSNCGFIGIPFIDMMTGGNAKAIMFVAVYNVAFNILVWTLGVYLMTQNKKDISWKHAFLNPSMIGSYIGLLLFFLPQINIFNMPAVKELQQFPVYFADMTSVLSMFIVGIRMADIPIKKLFNTFGSYCACALRLIVCPLLAVGITLVFKAIYPVSDIVLLSVAVAAAMSPASTCVAYAETFDGDKNSAATTFILGTLLSVFTVPVFVSLLSLFLSL